MRHELHVVDAVRNSPVLGGVARDEAANVHRACGGRADLRSRLDDRELGDPQLEPALRGGLEHRVRGTGDVETGARSRRDDLDVRAVDRERRVLRRLLDATSEPVEPLARGRAADP